MVAAITLLVLNRIISSASVRNRRLNRIIKGTPTILINRGHVIKENLRSEFVTIDELHAAMRDHGICTIENVRLAVLEIDGSISVIENGKMNNASLNRLEKKLTTDK